MNEREHPDENAEPERPEPALLPDAVEEMEQEETDGTAPSERERHREHAGLSLYSISLDDAPSDEETNLSVVREGISRYGQSFLAYLILDGVEQRSPDLIEQYEQRYVGSFADRHDFAAWALTDQGWADELIALRQLQGMGPDDVKWDTDRLWPALVERYDLTERLGGVHAFRR